MSDLHVSVIVPCLNEEQNIPTLVDKLQDVLAGAGLRGEVLIVDDCSDDYTFREALAAEQHHDNVRALHKGLPRGIGHAIRFGIDHAAADVGVVVMGDCVDPLWAIPDFVDQVRHHGVRLALLSRWMDPADSRNIPLSYRFYQRLYRLCCSVLVGTNIRDITYAFRGFDLEWVRSLRLRSGGFEISPEMTLKTVLAGGKVVELKGRQGRRIAGESKFVFSREGFGYARVLLEAAVGRLQPSAGARPARAR